MSAPSGRSPFHSSAASASTSARASTGGAVSGGEQQQQSQQHNSFSRRTSWGSMMDATTGTVGTGAISPSSSSGIRLSYGVGGGGGSVTGGGGGNSHSSSFFDAAAGTVNSSSQQQQQASSRHSFGGGGHHLPQPYYPHHHYQPQQPSHQQQQPGSTSYGHPPGISLSGRRSVSSTAGKEVPQQQQSSDRSDLFDESTIGGAGNNSSMGHSLPRGTGGPAGGTGMMNHSSLSLSSNMSFASSLNGGMNLTNISGSTTMMEGQQPHQQHQLNVSSSSALASPTLMAGRSSASNSFHQHDRLMMMNSRGAGTTGGGGSTPRLGSSLRKSLAASAAATSNSNNNTSTLNALPSDNSGGNNTARLLFLRNQSSSLDELSTVTAAANTAATAASPLPSSNSIDKQHVSASTTTKQSSSSMIDAVLPKNASPKTTARRKSAAAQVAAFRAEKEQKKKLRQQQQIQMKQKQEGKGETNIRSSNKLKNRPMIFPLQENGGHLGTLGTSIESSFKNHEEKDMNSDYEKQQEKNDCDTTPPPPLPPDDDDAHKNGTIKNHHDHRNNPKRNDSNSNNNNSSSSILKRVKKDDKLNAKLRALTTSSLQSNGFGIGNTSSSLLSGSGVSSNFDSTSANAIDSTYSGSSGSSSASTGVFYGELLFARTQLVLDGFLYAKALASNGEYKRCVLLLERNGVLNWPLPHHAMQQLQQHQFQQDQYLNKTYSHLFSVAEKENGGVVALLKACATLFVEASLLAAGCLSTMGQWDDTAAVLDHAIRPYSTDDVVIVVMAQQQEEQQQQNPDMPPQHVSAPYNSYNYPPLEDGGDERIYSIAKLFDQLPSPTPQSSLLPLSFCSDIRGDIHLFAKLCCARGRVYDEMGNPMRGKGWLRAALLIDPLCVEALDYLSERNLMSAQESMDLISSLVFDESESEQQQKQQQQNNNSNNDNNEEEDDENEWLKDLYIARLGYGSGNILAPTIIASSLASALSSSMLLPPDNGAASNNDNNDGRRDVMDNINIMKSPQPSLMELVQNQSSIYAPSNNQSLVTNNNNASIQYMLSPPNSNEDLSAMAANTSGIKGSKGGGKAAMNNHNTTMNGFGNSGDQLSMTNGDGYHPSSSMFDLHLPHGATVNTPINSNKAILSSKNHPKQGNKKSKNIISSSSSEVDWAFFRLRTKHSLSRSSDVLALASRRAYISHHLPLALKLTTRLQLLDPLNPRATLVHIATLTALRKKRQLFQLAHELVDSNPKNGGAWYAVGCYYFCCGRYDLAQRYFCRATRLEPRCAEAWIGFGCAFAACDESDQALAAYRAANRLLQHGGASSAKEVVEDDNAIITNNAIGGGGMGSCHTPMLYIGMEHLRTNHLTLADHFLSGARQMNPNDPLCFNEIGVCLYRKGKFQEAVDMFLHALRLRKRLDEHMRILSRGWMEQDEDNNLDYQGKGGGETKTSDNGIMPVHDNTPSKDKQESSAVVSDILFSFRKELKSSDAVLNCHPPPMNDSYIIKNSGRQQQPHHYINSSKLKESTKPTTSRRRKKSCNLSYNNGNIVFHNDEYDVITSCRDAFWEPTVFNLGQCYRKLRKFHQAIVCFESTLGLDPENSSSYAALGFTRHLVGNTDGAIEAYHQALSMKPNDTFCGEMLNRALQESFTVHVSNDIYTSAATNPSSSSEAMWNESNAASISFGDASTVVGGEHSSILQSPNISHRLSFGQNNSSRMTMASTPASATTPPPSVLHSYGSAVTNAKQRSTTTNMMMNNSSISMATDDDESNFTLDCSDDVEMSIS